MKKNLMLPRMLMFGGKAILVQFEYTHTKIGGTVCLADDDPSGHALDHIVFKTGFRFLTVLNHFHGSRPAFL